MKPVAVVVLGDLARSPRMLNHARMLAAQGVPVELVGYLDKPLSLPEGVRVCALHPMARAPEGSSPLHFLSRSLLRMSALGAELTLRLIRMRPQQILAQNPPSFPTLLASWVAARSCGSTLVVDWHNYGHSIMALRLPASHALLRLARSYELRVGGLADAHFCVSEAMRRELASAGVHAELLYDRPQRAVPATDKPASRVVVCSTGWTADEDIPLLLQALAILDARPDTSFDMYLTGDGPLREATERKLERAPFQRVRVHFGYLPLHEYRQLLGRADLGVSLHRSSSGVDLAMKVVDMFEARLPVCALDTGTSLPEQVRDGVTGLLFQSAQELAERIHTLLTDHARRAAMRVQIEALWRETWAEQWQRVAAPLLGAQAP